MHFNNKVYDFLKATAQIYLPALGTLYATLGTIYGFEGTFEPTNVVATVLAVDTFLGVVLGLSTRSYNNSDAKYAGSVELQDGPNGKVIGLDLSGDPAALGTKGDIVLKNNLPVEF